MKTLLDQSHCSPATVEVPAGFCRQLADSLIALKERLIAKYEDALPGRRHLARQLVAEAEALAWETPFPHLFLPDFAEARFTEALAVEELAFAEAA